MSLSGLQVLHRLRLSNDSPARISKSKNPAVFEIKTCMRTLKVTYRDQKITEMQKSGFDLFEGSDAYQLLLEVGTGLQSKILGETDIFGQIKTQWNEFKKSQTLFDPLMKDLFEDIKFVRSKHLEKIGGHSYGSLVRGLVSPREGEKVLFVGAGQLAESIIPYFSMTQNTISNRTAVRAKKLALKNSFLTYPVKIVSPSQEEFLWNQFAHAIICTPENPNSDSRRIVAWSGKKDGTILHLGISNSSNYETIKNLLTLDDVFNFQKNQSRFREAQIKKAKKVCREKAILRALNSHSSTNSHGWEDLANFA